jgi:hypothetical protein
VGEVGEGEEMVHADADLQVWVSSAPLTLSLICIGIVTSSTLGM